MLDQNELKEIVDIGIELTAEKDENKLLYKILSTAMKVANCDSAILYLLSDNSLKFKIVKNISLEINQGVFGEEIDIPPVKLIETNVCAYAAIHRQMINIQDIYDCPQFDFSGPIQYDKALGYKSKSMLVVPLENVEGKLVGVLQLINSKDIYGNVVPFSNDDEYALKTLGSQAAVSITNMLYVQEVKDQMYSFVEAFSKAIDERTPYNGSHTIKVTSYAEMLANRINYMHELGLCVDYFDQNRMEQLILAASLHDIGKMVVPLTVMNKSTRLEEHLEIIRKRFELIEAYLEIDYLKGKITEREYNDERRYLKESLELIEELDTAPYVSTQQAIRVGYIANRSYIKAGSDEIFYLTKHEKECLSIKKGTLTSRERAAMESHVVMTGKILEKVHFHEKYQNVRKFAETHHELLDGSGYPKGLRGENLPLETRILTVVDIYDALTSEDRPYKKAVSRDKAFEILTDMAKDGKIELRLVEYLRDAVNNEIK